MPKAKSGIKSRPTKRKTGVGSKGVSVGHGVGGGRKAMGAKGKTGSGVSVLKRASIQPRRVGGNGRKPVALPASIPTKKKPVRKPIAKRRGR